MDEAGGEDRRLRKWLVKTADEHGAAVTHVPADDQGSGYAFSAGVWRRYGRPEVVAIGLGQDVAHAVINTYVRRIAGGERFVPGWLYEGFLDGCPVTFEKVAYEHYPEYLGSAILMYGGDDFPAVQMIAAMPNGVFPWQPEAPAGFAAHQPVLTTSGRPESWTPGEDGP